MTNHWIIQNVGVLGNVKSSGVLAIDQKPVSTVELRDFISSAQAALPSVPASVRASLSAVLADLADETKKSEPDEAKLRSLLTSAKNIAEGAAGSIAASGIASLIARLLGG